MSAAIGREPNPRLIEALHASENITARVLYGGNNVEMLVDGRQTYDAMYEAVDQAQRCVYLEIYILADDAVGHRLVELLCRVAKRGVAVRVILDGLGSRSALTELMPELQSGGVQVQVHHPLRLAKIRNAWYRDHRKLMIVDENVAFAGGINFSESYASRRRSRLSPRKILERGWRDTHARFTGPCLHAFVESFERRWQMAASSTRSPVSQVIAPTSESAGTSLVRIAESTGLDRINSEIIRSLLAVIERAQQRVWLTHAYFAPPRWFVSALCDTAKRGVDVRLLLPARSDFYPVQVVARSHYTRLLRAGVRIFEYQAEILHAKCATVDGVWSSLGSCNLDWRSLKFNEELNAEVVGHEFATQLEAQFERDLTQSLEILRGKWRLRGVHRRLGQWLMRSLQHLW